MTAFSYAKHYQALHEANTKWFSGQLDIDTILTIRDLVRAHDVKRLLDWGSGKGYQYLAQREHEYWGVLPHCYDVGVHQLTKRPEGVFEGIICTDVIEHIAEGDLDEVLGDMLSFAAPRAFLYLTICCRPAWKTFPNGLNVHLTVKPPDWWRHQLTKHQREGLLIYDDYEYFSDPPRHDVPSSGV